MKKRLQDYRPGAAGSLMDEYERAAAELRSLVLNIGAEDYSRVGEGESDHCRSIEIIMNHVVRAGFGYAKYIRDALAMDSLPVEDKQIPQSQVGSEIDKMLACTAEIFEGRWNAADKELENVYFRTRWDVTYNVDQLLEHAIVHILRHRRQIEKFLLRFGENDEV